MHNECLLTQRCAEAGAHAWTRGLRAQHDGPGSAKVQRDAQRERSAVAAGRVAHEADQPGPEGIGELADARGEPDQHAEGRRRKLALHDQRGERDDVADREAVDGAGGQQRRGVLRLRHHRQRRRLRCERNGAGHALVDPLRERAERQAPDNGHAGGDGDGDAGRIAPDRRLQEGDLVHEEAGLRRDGQGEGGRHAPEGEAAQRGGAGPLTLRLRRGAALRLQRHLVTGRRARDACAEDGVGDRQHQRQDQGGAGQHGRREARGPGEEDQRRHDHHAAEAGAVQRQADGEAALPLEPQPQDGVDGAEAHGGPGERHHQVGGDELPGRLDERRRYSFRLEREGSAIVHARTPKRRIASAMNTTSSALKR